MQFYTASFTQNTMILGVLLIVLGVGTFAMVGFEDLLVLLPAAFGLSFWLLGMGAERRVLWRRPLLRIAILLALVAVAMMGSGFINVLLMMAGIDVRYPTTAMEQGITAMLCVAFLVSTLRSVRGSSWRHVVGEGMG